MPPCLRTAQWNETPVAVKILLNNAESETDIKQALTLSAPTLRSLEEESGLLAGLRHPNIVQARQEVGE